MTTLGSGGKLSDIAPLVAVDGKERNDGIEAKMDLDAIFDHTMRKYRAKTGEILNDDWDEEEQQELSEVPRLNANMGGPSGD